VPFAVKIETFNTLTPEPKNCQNLAISALALENFSIDVAFFISGQHAKTFAKTF